MRETKLVEMIFHLLSQSEQPLTSKQIAQHLLEHPFYIHKVIEMINLDQLYIEHSSSGYYLKEQAHYNQYKTFRKLRACVLLNDYEAYAQFDMSTLKTFDKEIRIVGVYYLYQPISSSKTEFLINFTTFRPILQAPMVFVQYPFTKSEEERIKDAIHQTKSRLF